MENMDKGSRHKGNKNLCTDSGINADSGTGGHGCQLDECDLCVNCCGCDLYVDFSGRTAGVKGICNGTRE